MTLLCLRRCLLVSACLVTPSAQVTRPEATLIAAGQAVTAVEHLTSFQHVSPTLSPTDFHLQFQLHGAVLFQFYPSSMFLQDAFQVLDAHLRDMNVTRMHMSSVDNVSANPLNTSTGVSPLRMRFKDHAVLAPADDTVQGPHQEGASCTRGNRRVIAFMCEEPATRDGGTALFDMQKAWEVLPEDLKERLRGASFGYPQHDGKMLVVPAVVSHDVTGRACLQFYCFGRASRDCVDVYRHHTQRYHVRPDPYQYDMHADADLLLIDAGGERRPFIGLDLYRMLTSIYVSMIAHTWRKGDVLVVDNIRWAMHAWTAMAQTEKSTSSTMAPKTGPSI
eukprot:CAMPEP_0171097922 /NCGR_PEP_ID=MMETSP0766_2-20121228/47830_1 /TAXON_ID=439317 /ORGANISM="Gambierdiscus australes, Strain CAWD 149" /LENGTH=333 /DNA_ID=CAMNT_0011557197 /DNA_START=48 /DNA_END=1050 /DNA_ORIENTATION=+